MEEFYRFDEATYAALDASGIRPLAVLSVLHGRQRFRRHTGAVLQLAGRSSDGTWLGVALIEDAEEDHYLVVGARALDETEIRFLQGLEEP